MAQHMIFVNISIVETSDEECDVQQRSCPAPRLRSVEVHMHRGPKGVVVVWILESDILENRTSVVLKTLFQCLLRTRCATNILLCVVTTRCYDGIRSSRSRKRLWRGPWIPLERAFILALSLKSYSNVFFARYVQQKAILYAAATKCWSEYHSWEISERLWRGP